MGDPITGGPADPVWIKGMDAGERLAAELPSSQRVISRDYLLALAEGDVANHESFEKLAASAVIGTTRVPVWAPGTAYTLPTAGAGVEVVSSSANDAAAGSGARTVEITYIQAATFLEKTEVITLNGVTPVPSVALDIYRINRFRVVTAGGVGLAGVAAGNIDVRHLADTPICSRIAAGYTRARTGIFTIPDGKALYITSVVASGGTGAGSRFIVFSILSNWISDSVSGLFYPKVEIAVENGGLAKALEMPVKIGPRADVVLVAESDGASTLCRAAIRGWIENA